MQLVFFGTPEFAVPTLAALAASRHRVLAVVTQPDRPGGRGLASRSSPVKRAALERGLEVREPERLKGEFVRELGQLRPEALVVIAYGRILPIELLDLAPGTAINVHASLLPRHRGASPIQTAILAGDAETGVTTMQMEAGLDTGPILLQARTPLGGEETAETLATRLSGMGASLLLETLDRLERDELAPRAQDAAEATYAPRITAEDAWIDWRQPAALLDRRVRAYQPWPGAVTTSAAGRRLKIRRARALAGRPAEPGAVLQASPAGVEVGCGEGSLLVVQAQVEGQRVMPAWDLVNGRLLRVGDRLGG